jgi:hypothetical protein
VPESLKQKDYRVESLGKQNDRSVFVCGVEPLDRCLRKQAGQDARKRVAAPFVLCEGKSNAVVGHYTLSALSVDAGAWPEDVARKLPSIPSSQQPSSAGSRSTGAFVAKVPASSS